MMLYAMVLTGWAVAWFGGSPLRGQEDLPPPLPDPQRVQEVEEIAPAVPPRADTRLPDRQALPESDGPLSPIDVRIKDITTIEGERINIFTGMGLVTGLNGTGGRVPATRQFALSMLERFGQRADPNQRSRIRLDPLDRTDNLSVVTVTAEVRMSDHRQGNRVDVMVSAFDDATSLQGGVLMLTPLYGVDGEVYAVASGPVSIGGFSFSGAAASIQENHPTTGRIPNGATIEKDIYKKPFAARGQFTLNLRHPDLQTATRITQAINQYWKNSARTVSHESVEVRVPVEFQQTPEQFAALIEAIRIEPDQQARVVINERTGTVVVGQHVRLSPVAITHANLAVITGERPMVSQPPPFAGGDTVVVPRTDIEVREDQRPINVIDQAVTVGELARALNALGVKPRDLSSIFQMLHAAGALHAELEFR